MSRRRPASIIGIPVLLVCLMSACTYVDPRAILDPVDGYGTSVYLLRDDEEPRDVTERVCPSFERCERAAESDRVRLLRFGTKESATAYVVYLGGTGYRSDRVVIEYRDGSITQEERRVIQSTIDGIASPSPD